MDVIDKQLGMANEQTLIELSNKGIYKRALKESKNMTISAEKIHECYIVKLDGETCTIKSPLDESQCSCVSRGMCRHIITAILLLKAQLPQYDGEDITPEVITSEPQQAEIELPDQPEINSLSQDNQKKIKGCAKQCIKIMSGIFTRGLVRAEESYPDNFELAAVSCHALRMAEAERQMRELGSRLKDCVSRRASFSPQAFTHKMFEYADSMNKLIKADITEEMLGTFRREYTDYEGALQLLPIGTRNVSGEYTGCIYYFLNKDRTSPQRFFTYSDLRPTFYERKSRRFAESTTVWDLDSSLNNYMHTELKLKNAKVSMGHLSSSSKTNAIGVGPAQLNCFALREHIVSDFKELAEKISANKSDEETDRLYFVHPKECVASYFDKHTQQQIFIIKDGCDRQISVTAKYTAENREFISTLETIGGKMLKEKHKNYVLLAQGYIDHGRLTLFPIEVYDFIDPPDNVPVPVENDTDQDYGMCSELLDATEETDKRIVTAMECGVNSVIADEHAQSIRQCGLEELAKRYECFTKLCENARHTTADKSLDIFTAAGNTMRYIRLCTQKLALFSAINNMEEKK